MLEREDIFSEDIQDEKYKLKNLTDTLILINYEKKYGLEIPKRNDLREGFLNPYIAMYNGLKLRLLKDKIINQEEFEKSLYYYLHEDERLLKKAINLASSRITNYEDEIIYVSNEEEILDNIELEI